jgi:hypothetical protein
MGQEDADGFQTLLIYRCHQLVGVTTGVDKRAFPRGLAPDKAAILLKGRNRNGEILHNIAQGQKIYKRA